MNLSIPSPAAQWRRLGLRILITTALLFGSVHSDSPLGILQLDNSSVNGSSQQTSSLKLSVGCPDFLTSFYEVNASQASEPFRSFTLTKGSAYAYFSLHFAKLWLPLGGSMLLRGVEDFDTPDVVLNLTAAFASGELHNDVYAPVIKAKELRIEVYRRFDTSTTEAATTDNHCYGFVADGYNYRLVDASRNITQVTEATCAQDNSVEAICYFTDYKQAYLASRTVARLLIRKDTGQNSACTGWLLGSEGHLITNNHCVQDDTEAQSMTVEFMADAGVCNMNCAQWGACEGTIEAIAASVVHTNASLDYSLLKLNTNVDLAKKYGFLRLKAAQGRVGQQIYIPQHPQYYGKRIAMFDDFATKLSIMNTNTSGCGGLGYSYTGDTQGGSSGSPIIDSEDHGVVALHHCGQYCANTGIPSVQIISDLQASGKLPNNAIDLGDKHNSDYFPAFAPTEAAAPAVLTLQLTLDGTIQVAQKTAAGASSNSDASPVLSVSVDQIEFTLASDADVEIDVLSVEISDDGTYHDVNGDCKAQYIDPVMYLFAQGATRALKTSDDTDATSGRGDGSVSYRDPYMLTFLKKGSYVLALSSVPLMEANAYNGTAVDQQRTPEVFTCSSRGGSSGSYRITMRSSDPGLTFTKLPMRVSIPTQTCGVPAKKICVP
ncbi:hypothetical protein Gpo141_00003872 [Globisporangium polare]